MARAVYRNADLYLFDDPLSAVDTLVGHQLFQNCISEYLNGKTRILTTHQTHFLRHVDTVAVIEHVSIFFYDGIVLNVTLKLFEITIIFL